MNPAVRGRLTGLAAAACYGVVTSFSKLAYNGGANPATVMVFRFAAASALLGLIIGLSGRTWSLAMSPRIYAGLTLTWYTTSFGHLGAVLFIPVSLSAIIFYTFPLLTVAYKRIVDRSRLTFLEAAGFVLAFAGLCIALGPTVADVDWRGIALAASASVSAAAFLVLYERTGRQTDEVASAFWLSAGALAVGAATLLVGFEVALPTTGPGIFGITAMAGFGLVAFLFNLNALKLAGAATTAMLLNLEPVVIFLMAALVVGEQITAARSAGLVLVLSALALSQWSALRRG